MRRMNLGSHGLKKRPPSWTIPCLMYAKEIRWLLRSIYIRSQTPFAVKLVDRFGNGSVRELCERSIYERSFTSEPSIEKYQAKPGISNEHIHENTTVHLDVIENTAEYQKLL